MTLPPPATHGAVRHPLPAELIHDLRTPLTQILGYTEMLIEQAQEAGDHGYVPDLRKVNAAGHRLLALMEERLQSVRAPASAASPAPSRLLPPEEGPDATR